MVSGIDGVDNKTCDKHHSTLGLLPSGFRSVLLGLINFKFGGLHGFGSILILFWPTDPKAQYS